MIFAAMEKGVRATMLGLNKEFKELFKELEMDDKEPESCGNQTNKSDKGKLRLTLVPTAGIRAVAEVREYGNRKYGDRESWRSVEPHRYIDALYRHLLHVVDDPQSKDEESGLEHYKHVACNAMFLCELLGKGE